MGFLDMFDSPDTMSALLGVPWVGNSGSPQAPTPAPPTPQPAPQLADSTPPRGEAGDPNILGGANFLPRPNPAAMSGLPVGQPPAVTASGVQIMPRGTPDASAPGQLAPSSQASDLPAGQNTDGPPMPPADPRMASAPPMPVADPRKLPPGAEAVGGVPLPPPSAGVPNSSPGGNGLAGQLGIAPMVTSGLKAGLEPGSRVDAALAGLGKGLSAVGALRPGASAGQAFSAGAGGALSGGYDADQKQKQELFSNSSAAFKDLLAAQQAGDTQAMRAAQTKLFNARAQSLMTGGGTNGSKAWQNTPFGRVIQVENEVNKFDQQQRLKIQRQLDSMGPDERKAAIDDMDKKADAYRQRLFKSAGIDPQQADKLKNAGVDQKNPIDTSGMAQEQFDAMVPMGAWYQAKGADGKMRVLQRVKPPGGWQQQSQQPTPQQGAAVSPQEDAEILRQAGAA